MVKLDPRWVAQALRALAACTILTMAVPAGAFHFPWDQGHDTTQSNDPNKPGPDDRDPNDPDCNGNSGRSPVYAANGQAFWRASDVMLRGRPYLGIYRVYNCADPVVGLFGNGWSVDFDIAFYPANSSGQQQRVYKAANGKRFVYAKQADGSYRAPDSRFDTVIEGPTTVTMTSLDGRRNVFALDGRLIQRIDSNGNVVNFGYDGLLRLNRIADEQGRALSLAYNGQGFVSTVTDHGNRVWRYAYDVQGNLIGVTNPAGGVTAYTWQAYRPPADAQTYYQLLTATDPSGVVQVNFAYTGNQVASYTDGANRHTYTRTASNTKLSGTVTERDATGATTSFVYGALGLVTRDVNGLGGTTNYVYDANGRVTQMTDPLGRVWNNSYDALGRLVSSSNPIGQVNRISYTGNDPRPARLTSPSGRTGDLSYDARGNLTAMTDPSGAVTRRSYNARGDLVTITNALGQVTQFAYSAAGLPIQVTDSLGRISTMTYDALGRLTSAGNAAGETTRYAYDALDRVTAMTDPLNQVTAFAYDATGRLVRVTDAKGSVTGYEYDGFGRRSAEVAPDGRRTTYAYRADNLLSTITWPDNTTVAYAYDNNKRVIRETAGTETTTYTYNAVDQLLSTTGPGGTVTYTYDGAGRVASETSNGRTNAITRNAEGERVQLSALGTTQTYARDARGMVTRIDSGAGTFAFGYDALGRRTQLTYPNGSTARYAFDAGGQLASLTHAGAFNASYTHTFDAAGRMSRVSGNGADWAYSYDALGRLTRAVQGASTFGFTLDAVGNSLDGGKTHDVNHRLVGDAARSYTYDQRGNLVLERVISSGARIAYGWNVKNQLLTVGYFPDGAATTPNRTLSFAYDPLGRRVSKTDNGTVQRYVYDGNDLIGRLSATNTVEAIHTFSGSVDEPLAVQSGGSTKTLYTNHIGSVVASSDSAGGLTNYGYGPYGQGLPSSTQDSVSFKFTGREQDTDDLYYYRARYYNPSMGRFLSTDKMGIGAGYNLYRYAGANPVSLRDPSGNCPWCLVIWGAVEIGLAIYDAYDTGSTLANPCASAGEKWLAGGLWAAGALLPGGGYSKLDDAARAADKFFDGTRYTDKVLDQIKRGDYHAFPESVTGFADAGKVTQITGGDGVVRDMLQIPGSYRGKDGVFEFIKEADGSINHRLFKPNGP